MLWVKGRFSGAWPDYKNLGWKTKTRTLFLKEEGLKNASVTILVPEVNDDKRHYISSISHFAKNHTSVCLQLLISSNENRTDEKESRRMAFRTLTSTIRPRSQIFPQSSSLSSRKLLPIISTWHIPTWFFLLQLTVNILYLKHFCSHTYRSITRQP